MTDLAGFRENRRTAPRVGLVLGAGGVVGQAFHAGVLAALEHDLGWDPRQAEVIVGTSAGSVTGSLLRLGVPASDLAAYAVEAPISEEAAELLEPLLEDGIEFPDLMLGSVVRGWRLPRGALLARIARRPWAFRPAVAALTLCPAGEIDMLAHLPTIEELAQASLPPGLRICAARRDDGARVVFGRDGAPETGLQSAIAASCAIPGYFKPVEIDGTEYFDGGVHSPTNADVLRHDGLDLVIVVSPMSVAKGRAVVPDAPVRWSAHRKLTREVNRLCDAGTTVVTFEPHGRSLAAMGVNGMANDRSDLVVQAAFVDAGRRTASPRVAKALAPLGERAAERRARIAS